MFKLSLLEFFHSFFFFFSPSYCKKPLTSNCTIQIATPGNDGDSTPKPVPILAAAFCTDKQSLLLVYGNTLQPIIEKVVCKTYWTGFRFCSMDCILLSGGGNFFFFNCIMRKSLFFPPFLEAMYDCCPWTVLKGYCILPFFQLKYNFTILLAVSCHFSCYWVRPLKLFNTISVYLCELLWRA